MDKIFSSLNTKLANKIPYQTTCYLLGVATSAPYILLLTIEFFSVAESVTVSLFYVALVLLWIGYMPAYNVLSLDLISNDATKNLNEFYTVLDAESPQYKEKLGVICNWKISSKHLWLILIVFLVNDVVLLGYELLGEISNYPFSPIINSFIEIAYFLPFLFSTLSPLLVLRKIIAILRGVYNLRKQPIKINILNLYPLFSLSRLSQRLFFRIIPSITIFGMWIVFIFLTAGPNTLNVYHSTLLPFFILTVSFLMFFSAFVFMLPVAWIQDLIRKKKKQELINIYTMLTMTYNEQDRLIAAGNFSGFNGLVVSANALQSRLDMYKRISAWPLETQTLLKHISSFLTPIIIWTIQYFLTQLFNDIVK